MPTGTQRFGFRTVFSSAICIACSVPAALPAQEGGDAAGFPARPIRMIVPFQTGGLPDISARLIGPKLLEAWKQQVVVDNRAGAGGIIGTDIVAKAIPEAFTDTVAGRVQFFMPPLASAAPLVKDGKLLALAVTTRKLVAGYEEIPTLAELGVTGFDWDAWAGLLAPAKTPRAIVNKLNREISRILSLPEVQQRMIALGVEAVPMTPAQFDKLIADQIVLTTRLARAAGIKVD